MAGGKGLIYRGSREICDAVGVNWKEISWFVKEKGLPAFKIDGKGGWKALPEDLEKWVQQMRNENINTGVER